MKKIKNQMLKQKNTQNAITLITLVITIIILLILAGVAINLSLGDNGLFTIAKKAKEEYLNAQTSEEEGLNDLYSEMLVATGDDSKITISVEDLNKLIDQRIQNTFCNPKLLTTVTLPNTGEGNTRATGTYYANTTSYTKTNSTDFDDYLFFDSNVGWTVLKSGFYRIDCYVEGSYSSSWNGVRGYLMIDDEESCVLNSGAGVGEYFYNNNSITVFFEEGTIINFKNIISSSPQKTSGAYFRLYSLFE